jgi:tetratricopeptide (TPR) repeat protein
MQTTSNVITRSSAEVGRRREKVALIDTAEAADYRRFHARYNTQRKGATRQLQEMKVTTRIIVVFTLNLLVFGQRTTKQGSSNHSHLESLHQANHWFELRDALRLDSSSDFYEGLVAAAFNDSERAEKILNVVIKRAPESPEAHEARYALSNLYYRSGQYRQALTEIDAELALAPDARDMESVRPIFDVLSQYPEQSITERRAARFRYRTHDNHIFVPVWINGKSANYALDSDARMSLMTESEAKRLGLRVREKQSMLLEGAAGTTSEEFRLAEADDLTVGNVHLKHVG